MVTLQSIMEMLNPQAAVAQGVDQPPPMRQFVAPPGMLNPQPDAPAPDAGGGQSLPDWISGLFARRAMANFQPSQTATDSAPYPDEAARRTAPLGGPQAAAPALPVSPGPQAVPLPNVGMPYAPPSPAPAPAPRPAPQAMPLGAPPAQAAPAAPNAAGDQFTQFIRALTAGAAAGSKPGLSMAGALAAGAGGATDRIYNEGKAKTKAEAEAAKQRFDQTLALRKDTREERGANRADAETTRKNAETESRRKLNESRVNEITEKMKVSAARSGIPGLTVAQAQKLNDQLNQYADKLKSNVTIANDFNQFESLLRKKREELIRDYVAGADAGKGGAPAQGGAPAAPTATGPDGKKIILKDGKWVPLQ